MAMMMVLILIITLEMYGYQPYSNGDSDARPARGDGLHRRRRRRTIVTAVFAEATTSTRRVPEKVERLEARVPARLKQIFKRAAEIRGLTMTDFVVQSAQAAASETIERHGIMMLVAQDRQMFVDALLNPPAPNAALRRAAKRYKEMAE